MKKSVIIIFAAILVLALCISVFVACQDNNNAVSKTFDNIVEVQEQYVIVQVGNKMQVYDGVKAIGKPYSEINYLGDGFFSVKDKNNCYGLMNAEGKLLNASSDKFNYSEKLTEIYPCTTIKYGEKFDVEKVLVFVVAVGNKYQLLNLEGKFIGEKYDSIRATELPDTNSVLVGVNEKDELFTYNFITPDGKVVASTNNQILMIGEYNTRYYIEEILSDDSEKYNIYNFYGEKILENITSIVTRDKNINYIGFEIFSDSVSNREYVYAFGQLYSDTNFNIVELKLPRFPFFQIEFKDSTSLFRVVNGAVEEIETDILAFAKLNEKTFYYKNDKTYYFYKINDNNKTELIYQVESESLDVKNIASTYYDTGYVLRLFDSKKGTLTYISDKYNTTITDVKSVEFLSNYNSYDVVGVDIVLFDNNKSSLFDPCSGKLTKEYDSITYNSFSTINKKVELVCKNNDTYDYYIRTPRNFAKVLSDVSDSKLNFLPLHSNYENYINAYLVDFNKDNKRESLYIVFYNDIESTKVLTFKDSTISDIESTSFNVTHKNGVRELYFIDYIKNKKGDLEKVEQKIIDNIDITGNPSLIRKIDNKRNFGDDFENYYMVKNSFGKHAIYNMEMQLILPDLYQVEKICGSLAVVQNNGAAALIKLTKNGYKFIKRFENNVIYSVDIESSLVLYTNIAKGTMTLYGLNGESIANGVVIKPLKLINKYDYDNQKITKQMVFSVTDKNGKSKLVYQNIYYYQD